MEEKEELPFPIEDLELKDEPLIISFSEPLKEPTVLLDTPLFEENLPDIGNEVPYEEVITEVPLPFVQKQASYGLLDGKYLIRY